VSVYFDVNVGDAGKLQLPLELLEKTLADLDQGHIPYTAVIARNGSRNLPAFYPFCPLVEFLRQRYRLVFHNVSFWFGLPVPPG